MKTNLLRFWITALMLLVTTSGYAYDACVDGIYYNFEDSNATVTYYSWGEENATAYKGNVVIPSIVVYNGETYNVNAIGNYAFYDCYDLENIIIPENITSIGNMAFYFCLSLGSITIPGSVTSIGYGAFEKCALLTNITIPEGVTSIGREVFSGCQNLTNVTISEGLTSIEGGMFYGCERLTNITIPQSVTSIGSGAFEHCASLKNITIPESVTSIGYGAFQYCASLESITIPGSVTNIDCFAFAYCKNLASVNLQEGIKVLYGYAFANAPITDITIPRSVEHIDGDTFRLCDNITSIKCLPLTAPETWGYMFGNNKTIHVYETAKGYDVAPWTSHTIIYDIPFVTAKDVAIEASNIHIDKSEQTTLHATISPDDVTINELEWSSSDESVLKSLGNGVFEGIADGYAYVRATTVDGSNLTAECRVSVGSFNYVDVAAVTITPTTLTLHKGETGKLQAMVTPENATIKDVVWTCSDEKISTIDAEGNVTALAKGEVTITATSKDNDEAMATCRVSVLAPYTKSLELNKTDVSMETSETLKLIATPTPSDAEPNVVWISNDEKVVMVDDKGNLTPMGEGEATVTAKATDGSDVTASVKVKVVPVLVKSITLNYTSYTLDRGENVQLVASLLPENAANKEVKWSTDNEDVIMVNSNGRCVYLTDGKATVTATTCDGSNLSASCIFNCSDGIVTITTDSPNLEVFTTDGRRINDRQNGINIIRGEDGKSLKVLKK